MPGVCGAGGEPGSEVERQRLEASARHDRSATGRSDGVVAFDHLLHPVDLPGEIKLVHAGASAGPVHRLAVACIRADEVGDDPGPFDHGVDRRGVSRVSQQHPIRSRIDGAQSVDDPAPISAGHRPTQTHLGGMAAEITGRLPTGHTGGPEKDHVVGQRHNASQSRFSARSVPRSTSIRR